MKLHYSPGACSLVPHIIFREAGLNVELAKFDFATRKAADGRALSDINPRGTVPTLELDNGTVITQVPAVSLYLASLSPAANLVPAAGSVEYFQVLEWLAYINSEVHKLFRPLFSPGYSDAAKDEARAGVNKAFDLIEKYLAGKTYLVGNTFTVADVYQFVIISWAQFQKFDFATWPNLAAYSARIGARPKVQEAMQAEWS